MRFLSYISITLLCLTNAIPALILPSDAALTSELYGRGSSPGKLQNSQPEIIPPEDKIILPRDKIIAEIVIATAKSLQFDLRRKDKSELKKYLRGIVTWYKIEDQMLISALIYLEKIGTNHPKAKGNIDAIKKVSLTGIILSYKMREDKIIFDSKWAEKTGFSQDQLWTFQKEALLYLDHRLEIPLEVYDKKAKKYGLELSDNSQGPIKRKKQKKVGGNEKRR